MGIFGPGRHSFQAPPKSMGEYRVIGPGGVLKYIGKTVDLYRRYLEHRRAGNKMGPSDKFGWKEPKPGTTRQQLTEYESAKIDKHKPSLNRIRGGGGRLPKT